LGYVQLGDVETYYEVHGEGEPLLLLHPGGVDARAFAPNLGALAARFRVLTPERRGHGRTADVDGPISYELMAQDTIAFLEAEVGGPAHLVGCSDGATVALHAALRRPDLARRVVLVAGVFHRDGWAPGVIEDEIAAANGGNVTPLAAKLARMHAGEPGLTAADLARVTSRTLVMAGDDDEVTLEHAAALYRGLPDAELAIVPGTSHGLLVEKPTLCNLMIVDFLTSDPVPTMAPIRRRSDGL
jgi:pimeloyl-ACP methyl ester carboxylesterase